MPLLLSSILSPSILSNLNRQSLLCSLALTAASLLAAGCGTSVSNTNPVTGAVTGSSFIVGTDAPMASVTSFSVQVQAVNAIESNGTTVSLLSGSPTVDFARFNGLQTLLDMNDVPAGTYTGVSITLGPATIGYLNTSSSSAPTITTEAATLTTSTVTYTTPTPIIISQSGPAGLHLDFDLRKSILVDSNGQITGQVTPTFHVSAVGPADPGAYLDEFDAAVVSVNNTAQSFVVQGPHGRQFTIDITGNTMWDNSESLSSLTTSSIVQISGQLDRADATIDADEVAILSQNGFYADGQVTYVTPSTRRGHQLRSVRARVAANHDRPHAGSDRPGQPQRPGKLLHLPGAQHTYSVPVQLQPDASRPGGGNRWTCIRRDQSACGYYETCCSAPLGL